MEDVSLKKRIEVILKREESDKNNGSDNKERLIEISLREIIEVIINAKKMIAIVMIISLITAYIGVNLTSSYTANIKAVISFNYDGIDKGLDPYGKKLDIGKIKAPVITSEVIKTLGLDKMGLTADDIGTNLEIVPIIPGDVTAKIKAREEAKDKNIKELEEFVYYPNKYTLVFSIPKKLNIDKILGQKILNEIVKEYEEYFYFTYSDRSVLANAIGTINYEKYDYPEISTIIHEQISIMNSYLAAKNKVASDFRSKKTGLSFNDIIESVSIIDSVDLTRMDSLIGSFNLTKDKEKLIKLYEHKIKQNELKAQKKEDEARIVSDAVNKYQKDKNLVLIPGAGSQADGSGVMEFDKTDTFYSELTGRLTDAGVEARNSIHDSEYLKKEIERIKNDIVSAEDKKGAEKDVIELGADVKQKLENLIKLTNDTVAEYYEAELYNKALTKLSPAQAYSSMENLKLILLVSAVAGLMIGMLAAFFRSYWLKSGIEVKNSKEKMSV